MATKNRGRQPERPPFWVAFGFISAFAATILTVVLTGLYVRAPGSQSNAASGADSVEVTTEPARSTSPTAAPNAVEAAQTPRKESAAAPPGSGREEAEEATSASDGDGRDDSLRQKPAESR